MGINLGNIATSSQNITEGVVAVDRGEPNGLSLNLSKGISLDLTKSLPNLNNVKVGLGWDANDTQPVDLDVFALLLHGEKIKDATDIIFFNQKDTGKGVRLNGDNRTGAGEGDDETMNVCLSNVPQDVTSILFFVNVYDAEAKRQNFGMVKNAYIRLINEDTGKEEAIYVLNEQGGLYTAFKFAKLERNSNGWSFKTLGEGTHGNVQVMANKYL